MVLSCAEFRSLEVGYTARVPADLSVGDKVQILTSSSQQLEFEVVEITDSAVVGEHVVVPFEQIVDIKLEEVDAVETTLAVGFSAFSVVAIGVMVWLLFALS